jgi:hypothetical protein
MQILSVNECTLAQRRVSLQGDVVLTACIHYLPTLKEGRNLNLVDGRGMLRELVQHLFDMVNAVVAATGPCQFQTPSIDVL